MRLRVLGAVVLVLGIGAAMSRADDKPLERSELDKRVVRAVYDSAVLGTEIFNKGNHEGCYRLYLGTLMSVQPLLDHRAKLASSVKERIEKAKMLPKAADAAFELRAALDDIQNDIAPGPKTTTLWERLGGEPGVKKVVGEVMLRAAEDPKVNFLRNKTVKLDAAKLETQLVAWISGKTDGPIKYAGKDMKTAHAGMKITEDEFNALGAIILEVLKKYKVADTDMKVVMDAITATKPDVVEVKSKN